MIHHNTSPPSPANLSPTAILDFSHANVQRLVATVSQANISSRTFLQMMHLHLVQVIRPVYSVNERQPVSATLERGRGSCSQRMASLEAAARVAGIPTRVHALTIRGCFWYPRFRFSRFFIPKNILLVWPQFFFENTWVDLAELHASMDQLAGRDPTGFTNDGESLFEAITHTPVDFLGQTCAIRCAKPEHNLSRFLETDNGFFDTRDEAFERLGCFQDTIRGKAFEMIFGDQRSS